MHFHMHNTKAHLFIFVFVDTYVCTRARPSCWQAALWRQEKFCDIKLRVGDEVSPRTGSCLRHSRSSSTPSLTEDARTAVPPSWNSRIWSPVFLRWSWTGCTTARARAGRRERQKAEFFAAGTFVAVAGEACLPAASLRTLLARDDRIMKDERQIFETLSVWLKKQEPPLTQEAQIEMFSLVRFPLLPLDLLQSSDVAENTALTSLARRTMLLAQFPNAYLALFPEALFPGSARTNSQVAARIWFWEAGEAEAPVSRLARRLAGPIFSLEV